MKAETRSRTPTTKTTGKKATASVSRIAPKKASKPPQTRTLSAAADPAERHRLVAEAAYFRAEKRGFVPGHEEMDWLEAEKDFDVAAVNQ